MQHNTQAASRECCSELLLVFLMIRLVGGGPPATDKLTRASRSESERIGFGRSHSAFAPQPRPPPPRASRLITEHRRLRGIIQTCRRNQLGIRPVASVGLKLGCCSSSPAREGEREMTAGATCGRVCWPGRGGSYREESPIGPQMAGTRRDGVARCLRVSVHACVCVNCWPAWAGAGEIACTFEPPAHALPSGRPLSLSLSGWKSVASRT